MKILVLGLDCAAPELLLDDPDLENVRRLMAAGCYGHLESVIPPITVPAWMCMATSRDPGSLGVYGFRNRRDYSYAEPEIANSRSIDALTIWDQIARVGGRAILIGVPPSYPPRRVNGISVGCFLTPDPERDEYTYPSDVAGRIRDLVGSYAVDVKDFRTDDKDRLERDIYQMTKKRFEVVRSFIRDEPWDYFQLVEIGLDRMHHGFWKHHDPKHPKHDPRSPYRTVIRDYYRYLDHEIGTVLELVDGDTAVLVVSDHGARALEGGFCINEWLAREGDLALRKRPSAPTPLDDVEVDWDRTRAWSAGGYYARVFLNVRGREPHGTIDPEDYERTRDDLITRLEAITDPTGRLLDTRAYRPQDLYHSVEGIAPDLIVVIGDLAWRAIGSVGHSGVHVEENDTGPDDCNHAQYGAFVLAAPGLAPLGELERVHLLDIAPTLLALAGYDVPSSMQGKALPLTASVGPEAPFTPEGQEAVRERLKGLGYIS